MSEMTDGSGPEPAELLTDGAPQGTEARAGQQPPTAQRPSLPPDSDETGPAGRPHDRRHQRRWVPLIAGLLALLLGLAYIIEGFRTRVLYSHLTHPLHKLTEIAPGLLSIVPRVADVIIGLMLLMLSHGLRRRKRRAWEGVILLLALSVLTQAVLPGRHLLPAAGAVVLLVILWFYRK